MMKYFLLWKIQTNACKHYFDYNTHFWAQWTLYYIWSKTSCPRSEAKNGVIWRLVSDWPRRKNSIRSLALDVKVRHFWLHFLHNMKNNWRSYSRYNIEITGYAKFINECNQEMLSASTFSHSFVQKNACVMFSDTFIIWISHTQAALALQFWRRYQQCPANDMT